MNKIIVENDKITCNLDKTIKHELTTNEVLGIRLLKIEILDDTNIELSYNFKKEEKLEVTININENKHANIVETIIGESLKIRTQYFLSKKSQLHIEKFNHINTIKEYVVINLKEQTNIEYILKTIAHQKEEYDILTYHETESKSEIITNGVAVLDGKIKMNVSSFVPKNKKNCKAIQNNKIINLTENECIIKPNLYIDEYDVEASHSAWIGNFNEQELFYLKSRGINKLEAEKLLVKGFLTNKIETLKDIVETEINKYWR